MLIQKDLRECTIKIEHEKHKMTCCNIKRQEEKEGIREGVRAFWICRVVSNAYLSAVLRFIRWKFLDSTTQMHDRLLLMIVGVPAVLHFVCNQIL